MKFLAICLAGMMLFGCHSGPETVSEIKDINSLATHRVCSENGLYVRRLTQDPYRYNSFRLDVICAIRDGARITPITPSNSQAIQKMDARGYRYVFVKIEDGFCYNHQGRPILVDRGWVAEEFAELTACDQEISPESEPTLEPETEPASEPELDSDKEEAEQSQVDPEQEELSIESASTGGHPCPNKSIALNPFPNLSLFRKGQTGTKMQFITKYEKIVEETFLLSGVPGSITMSQIALETGWGTSTLATDDTNNIGGLSCVSQTGFKPFTLKSSIWTVPKTIQLACIKERGRGEGGRYNSFKHHYDSIMYKVNRLLTYYAYQAPGEPGIGPSGSPSTVGNKNFSRWGIPRGIGAIAKAIRARIASNIHPKDWVKEAELEEIAKILDKVYAPDQADCATCPASNNDYDKKLLSMISATPRMRALSKRDFCERQH